MSDTNRSWKLAMLRGLGQRCPNCGTGHLFQGYVTTAPSCTSCGEAFHHHRADDAPPYLTITLVGHIVVPLLLAIEKFWAPALWIHFAILIPLTLGLTLWFLPRIKGAIVGLQWALGMHGFGGETTETPNAHTP